MEKKNNSLVIILMGVIIVILAVLCVLFATNTISLNNDSNVLEDNNTNNSEVVDNNIQKKNSDVGEYTYTSDNYSAMLDLLDDGTFYTKETSTSSVYFYGTYEIIDNKLKLNYLFKQSNAQGSCSKLNKIKEYDINSDNTITISNISESDEALFGTAGTVENIIIKKSSETFNIIDDFTNNAITLLMMEREQN